MSYIKNQEETAAIAEGGQLMGEILEKLSKLVAPGVTGADLDREAERLIRAVGGMPAFKGYRGRRGEAPFPGTICFSLNEELVHGIPTKEKIIKDGDIVSIDIGMQWQISGLQQSDFSNQQSVPKTDGRSLKSAGYFTDTAVTIAVGQVPEEIKKLLQVTREALEVGIRAAQPGRTVASIGKAIEEYVRGQGDYGIVRDLVGHGVGHAVHEEPRVPNYYDKSLEKWVLANGVVIAIEPMITLGAPAVETLSDAWTICPVDKSLNAHFEHTIIITELGPQVATRRPGEKS